MASTADTEMAAISPAQIAALSVSIFAILVFTSTSIYLCGRRKGCKVATQRAIHSIVHLHLHPHTRIPEDAARPRSSTATERQGTSGGGGRLTKLIKQIFGITAATVGATATAEEASSAERKQDSRASRSRATSPLQKGIHPGSSNRFSGTEEFQAAVHNLLGYRPDELQEWYSESDDDAHDESQQEQDEGSFPAVGHCGSPLPAYQEVAETEPHRFSWQGQESDYRPEKR
ncbi:hypothetical protein LEL_03558 [Akanthomyces lecanii RCEF 1005]|uniref:Transmembrane protein n=1 Tax=Akanthomyces lecanii RCEF 1005 TaxID=1081108 RepID=A0A162KAM2_CORDF|nr:hypothetical protein LEL_03558 [Akanthomyces lecanii RCEF 1005]